MTPTTRRQHRRARNTRPDRCTTTRSSSRRSGTTTTTPMTTCTLRGRCLQLNHRHATLLVPPGGPMPPHRGLHPNHDAFEDAYPTDEDAAEEPDWSRDSQDEADEEKDDDTTNLDKPGPSHGTRGSERPAEPVGAPPARLGNRGDLTAEETRTERNRRARAEWREWRRRRQQRRRGLAPGYFYPSGAERWQRTPDAGSVYKVRHVQH